jgi:hypothetical protein
MTPLGLSFFFSLPASFGIEVVEEGMLKTTQARSHCQSVRPDRKQ